MTRIEWTRLEGADVEAVVAMFLSREYAKSTRITPSRGDGGVDILNRNAGPDGSDVVYQVKRYATPLGQREKDSVEDSLATLKKDPRWAEINVVEWHLVLPLDPSPEAEKWLQDLGRKHEVVPSWDGLDRIESLASKYPEVVDYYLHGGRAQIEEAYREVAAAFGAAHTASGLSVGEIQDKVEKALLTLEHDPHYRYEHRFGSGTLPPPSSRPGLAVHMASADKESGRWSTVDVIARCTASTSERPIVLKGILQLEAGSEASESFQNLLAYGSPFQSPDGAFNGELDAPGGLSRSLSGATVHARSADGDIGDSPELHLEVLAPDGSTVAAVDVDRTERSRGSEGVRVVLEETNGVFVMEDTYNLTGKKSNRRIIFNDLTGKPVAKVLPALIFLTNCRPPNIGRVSRRYTPVERGTTDVNLAFPWPPETEEQLKEMTDLVGLLARLQSSTDTILTVPRATTVSDSLLQSWLEAAKILDGEEVILQHKQGLVLQVAFEDEAVPEGSFAVEVPLKIMLGDQEIELGRAVAHFDQPTLLGSQEIEGRIFYTFETSGREIRYGLLPD